jgi:hypothetical protein
MSAEIKQDHIFRKYLQDDLRNVDFPFFLQASVRFVLDLGIWIHPDAYQKLPIYEPLAYRDQKSQKPIDLRGQANPISALMIDDNSMVKNYATGKVVSSHKISYYQGKTMGNGFWACHIWDRLADGSLSNVDNSLFTFVPNLVWLPAEFSRLTDHVPLIKDVMKQLSLNLYKDVKFSNSDLEIIVDNSWNKLLERNHNEIIPKNALPHIDEYNLMQINDATIAKKIRKNKKYAEGLIEHGRGNLVPVDCQLHKYGRTIDLTNSTSALEVGTWLEGYLNALP